jgi:antitoxin HicB
MTELRAEAMGALEEGVARMMADRQPLPTPSAPQAGEMLVPLPLRMAAKLALHRLCREQGIGPAELARRLGCGLREAQRLLDTAHQTKIDRLADAVRRLGGPILTLGAVTGETATHHATTAA